MMPELIIGPGTMDRLRPQLFSPVIDGEEKGHGCTPRNFVTKPLGYLAIAPVLDIAPIPQSNWSGLLAQKVASKALLSDIRNIGMQGQPIPSRDQNGKGYCWAHSSTSASLLARAVNGDVYADLSAYAVACIIKDYADEGGNGIDSLDFIAKRGIPTSQFWPQQSMSRSNDNPQTWENAALHKIQAEWRDLGGFDQVATCLLIGIPVVSDYDWWSHSVCAADLVDGSTRRGIERDPVSGKLLDFVAFERLWDMNNPETGGFGVRIWNSWGDSWSENGMGVLTGSHAVPDSACAPMIVSPSET